MVKATVFDVLIVYSGGLSSSASSLSQDVVNPFAAGSNIESYNSVYGYFLTICRKNRLRAAFTTSSDISGPGQCRSYWLFRKNAWVKVRKPGFAKIIFDKFSPLTRKMKAERDLLFSSYTIRPFNHPYLFDLFFDKQKAYEKLSKFSIPTVPIIGNSRRNIEQTCKSLEKITIKHPNIGDFSDEIIMKDRFGAGGEHVYKFKTGQQRNMQTVMKKNRNISYIIQPLVAFDKGFTMNNSFVSADIRLIYSDGKVIQTYIRMAQKNDFRCNAHAGGSIKYFTNSELPRKVLLHAHKVFTALGKNKSLYSLDFIISNKGNTYLLEGNTGPGLNWSLTNDEDKVGAQKLIGIIVKQLSKLAHPPSRTLERENQFAIPPLDNADEYPPRPVIQLTA